MVTTLLYSSLLGIIPCLFWLLFWLREDSKNPEPKRLILACFIAGMLTTLIAIPLEYFVSKSIDINSNQNWVLFFWATIEEICKFGACYFIALRSKYDDEPIDNVIYMLAVALGFSALENTLFLLNPFSHGYLATGLLTSNLRFLGASLLHTLASAIVGICLSFAFYKSKKYKLVSVILGLSIAIAVHTIFNIGISNHGDISRGVFTIFSAVWIGIISVIMVIEKIKLIKK